MGDGTGSQVHYTSDGGMAASHPPHEPLTMLVAPVTGKERTTVQPPTIPIACWRLEVVRFPFDSSVIGKEAAPEFTELWKLREKHKDKAGRCPPMCIFGHADPVGKDYYNKVLSERRAAAVYAALVRDTSIWEKLYSTHSSCPGDKWGLKSIQQMLDALGYGPCAADGVMGDETKGAIRRFQGPGGSGNPDKATREKLFAAYMDLLCKDDQGKAYTLDRQADFLAQGKGKQGEGDYQGCSEFNPEMVFSQQEDRDFQQASDHTERDRENAANRRVVVFLFRPGSKVDPQKWPCKRDKAGLTGCPDRFWKSGQPGNQRRACQAERREYDETHDTFACRFYDRMAGGSPCERAISKISKGRIQVCDYMGKPLANTPYRLSLEGIEDSGVTDAEGWVQLGSPGASKGLLYIADAAYEVTFEAELTDDIAHIQAMLNALGFHAGPLDGMKGPRTTSAIKSYQRERGLDVCGEINDETKAALRKDHLISDS